MDQEIRLSIAGLGIIMYSDFAVSHIAEGENYLSSHYMTPEQVLEHVYQGTIVGFGTGSPGDYLLRFRSGYPEESQVRSSEFKLRLGIEVRDSAIVVQALYDLMEWSRSYPQNQVVEIENGFYHITLLGNAPTSGIIGDNQVIHVYLNKLESMPTLAFRGVPTFLAV